jgi:hypothetical protein
LIEPHDKTSEAPLGAALKIGLALYAAPNGAWRVGEMHFPINVSRLMALMCFSALFKSAIPFLIEVGVDNGAGKPIEHQGQSTKNVIMKSRAVVAITLPCLRSNIKLKVFDRLFHRAPPQFKSP